MIENLLSWIAFFLFTLAFILYLTNYQWLEIYIDVVIDIVCITVQIVIGLGHGLALSLPSIVRGSVKAVVTVGVAIFLATIYLISFIVPHVGKRTQTWKNRQRVDQLRATVLLKVRKMREIMVKIVAKQDDRDLEFDDPEKYRVKLSEVKSNAKDRLEGGETVLSISLGIVIVGTNLTSVKIVQSTIYGHSAVLLIELWLLAISVSIIYRTSVLEVLAYSSSEEFESLEEMDAALGYQKAVSLIGFIQGLTFLLVFLVTITRVKYDSLETILAAKYADEPWVSLAWEELTK